MATITSNGTGGGAWSSGSTWSGGVKPADDDAVTIAAGDSVLMDEDTSAMTGLRTVTITGVSSGTPGMLYFKNGTSGYLKIRTAYNLVGTNHTVKGRLLANSDGVWGNTGQLQFSDKATIELRGDSSVTSSQIDATYLDIQLYCYEPTTKYLTTYGTKYTCTTQSTDVNTSTNLITFADATPPGSNTLVRVRSTGTLPSPLSEHDCYYVRNITDAGSTFTCNLAFLSNGTAITLTSTGSGTLYMYDGHSSTSTATMNVFEDVSAETGWSTTDGWDRVVLVDYTSSDNQVAQLSTITSSSVTLSANVDSAQYPGARLYLASRNVLIVSNSTHNSRAMINQGTGLVLGCHIRNSNGVATYGAAIYLPVSATMSGVIECVNYASSLSGNTTGGVTLSGLIVNCGYGVWEDNHGYSTCTVSGTLAGLSVGIVGHTMAVLTGTSFGCVTHLSTYASADGATIMGGNTAANGAYRVSNCNIHGCASSAISLSSLCDVENTLISSCATGLSGATQPNVARLRNVTIRGGSRIAYGYRGNIVGHNVTMDNSVLVESYRHSVNPYRGTDDPQITIFDLNGVAGTLACWNLCGYMKTEPYSAGSHGTPPITPPYGVHVVTCEDSDASFVFQQNVFATKQKPLRIRIYARQPTASVMDDIAVFTLRNLGKGTDESGEVLSTWTMTDDNAWQAATLSCTSTYDRHVLLRLKVRGGNAGGTGTDLLHWFYVVEDEDTSRPRTRLGLATER